MGLPKKPEHVVTKHVISALLSLFTFTSPCTAVQAVIISASKIISKVFQRELQ